MTENDQNGRIDAVMGEIDRLQRRVAILEQAQRTGPGGPRTGLTADSFLKRAFAVWGHNFVASIIIAIPIWLFVFVLTLAIGFGWR